MSKKITVILAKAGYCGHCKDFEPIYEESRNNYKDDKYLDDQDINFVDYDLATDEGKNNFTITHLEALKMVEGYPTVLVNISDKNKKNNKYYTIDHTVVNHSINDDEEKNKEASKRFLINLSNLLKSLDSDNKVLYLQTGGGMRNYQTSLKEEIYRKKYLKYKAKYLELKNN
jgi:thiol-disulfide isomerase/thioredoxin